jgi:hypothetical protein
VFLLLTVIHSASCCLHPKLSEQLQQQYHLIRATEPMQQKMMKSNLAEPTNRGGHVSTKVSGTLAELESASQLGSVG